MSTERSNIGQTSGLISPRFAGLRTFARLPTIEQAEDIDVAILGAPFDGGTTFRGGSRFGPAAVREASLLLRPYNEPLRVSAFDDYQVVDAGDVDASPISIIAAHREIEAAAKRLTARHIKVLGLGGDHSVTLPLMRAACARWGQLSLIQFDAHTDTWDEYFGEKVTHGTIFRRAVEEGLIDPKHSVQVGLRGSVYAETDYRDNKNLGFHTVLARSFDELGLTGVLRLLTRVAILPTYITVDIDALDPAFAPGTGTPEPGGFTSRELLEMVRGLQSMSASIVAADVVEVSPPFDVAGVTAGIAANLAYDLIALLAMARSDASRNGTEESEHG